MNHFIKTSTQRLIVGLIVSTITATAFAQTVISNWKGATWNKSNLYQINDCTLDLSPFSSRSDEKSWYDFIGESYMRIQGIRLEGSCVNGKLEGDFYIEIDAKSESNYDYGKVSTAIWKGKAADGYPVGIIEHRNSFKKDISKLYCIGEAGCYLKFDHAGEAAAKANKPELMKYLNTTNLLTIESCKNSSVPNPNPLRDETTEFFGECQEMRAITGLIIWKQKNTPFDLSCIEDGKHVPLKEILNTGFRNGKLKCLESISALPMGCFKDGYRGQCNAAGEPDGVGFKYTSTSAGIRIEDHNIYAGMFKEGVASGFGTNYHIGRCGMLGCTGAEIYETGYFLSDAKQFDCRNGLLGCLEEKKRRSAALAAENAQRLKAEKEFASLLKSKNPQTMYLAAGSYGRNGDGYKAKQVYEAIISRFPSSSWAVKANDQLNDTKRSNDAESASSQRQYDAQRSNQEAASKSRIECSIRISHCEDSCRPLSGSSKSACWSSCKSLCNQF